MELVFGKVQEVTYTNWKGNTSVRKIWPIKIFFGSTEYHTEPQWLVEATDLDKRQVRTFALKDMKPNA